MEVFLHDLIHGLPWAALIGWIAVSLGALAKGADLLVDEAVTISLRWGVPTAIVGATIVSLGTTAPEVAVSVMAALKGSPGLALGNAVGSVICDTGLILGIGVLISPLKLDRRIVNRQGWIQLAAGFLLVLAAFPWGDPSSAFTSGGVLPRAAGFLFLTLLLGYIYLSIQWGRKGGGSGEEMKEDRGASSSAVLLKLLGAIAIVVGASHVLIPAVQEAATRLSVPEAVIAATLVAFGTSLPELVTVVSAARKGHGELAIGNVIGADILNVLFVAGAAASVTSGGLAAPAAFFRIYFPAMLFVLVIFRVGVIVSKDRLGRPFGFILLGAYVLATYAGYG